MNFGTAINYIINDDTEINNLVDNIYYLYYDERNNDETYIIFSYDLTNTTRVMGKKQPVLETYTLYVKIISRDAQTVYDTYERLKTYLQSIDKYGVRDIQDTTVDNAIVTESDIKVGDMRFTAKYEPN